MKKYKYTTKYLPTALIRKCFSNQFSLIDKTLCGNGFTTGFLKMRPSKAEQVNIIIVPNKQVIISKQEAQNNILKYGTIEEQKNLRNIGFFYADSTDVLDFEKYEVMMFVIDSFVNYSNKLIDNSHLIDKILIDEVHSLLIQSKFRNNLVGFLDFVKHNFTENNIACVTATPLLFQKVDIRLIPKEIEQRDVYISTNQENALKRIKKRLNNKEKVIVATQNVKVLKHLTDSNNVLEANFKVGKTFLVGACENVIVKQNKDSNLVIITSAGFEGFDIVNGKHNFFLFEDRAFDYQTFYPPNFIQALNRSRQGTNYIEWCRIPFSERKSVIEFDKLEKLMLSKRISAEKKMTEPMYSDIPKYYNVTQDKKTGLIIDFTFKSDAYNLDKELSDVDINGLDAMYKDYFANRGFTLHYLNEGHKRLKLRNASHKIAFKNLKANEKVIRLNSLMKGLRVDLNKKEKLEYYIKSFEVFLRRKYWNLETLPFSEDFVLTDEIKEQHSNIEKELFAYSIFCDEKQLDQACKIITKKAIKKKLQTEDKRSKEFKEWKKDLLENVQDRYIRLILAFSQKKVRVPKKIRNSRDYNLFSEVSMDLICAVADLFDVDVYELDVVSCNIRILYSRVGIQLPTNIY